MVNLRPPFLQAGTVPSFKNAWHSLFPIFFVTFGKQLPNGTYPFYKRFKKTDKRT
jgi:hypothetical protein